MTARLIPSGSPPPSRLAGPSLPRQSRGRGGVGAGGRVSLFLKISPFLKICCAAVLLAGSGAVRAEEANPFVPPSQRAADREAQIQQQVDKAVGDLENRIVQSLVNSIEGKAAAGAKEAPLAEALKKLSAANASAPAMAQGAPPVGGAFPALPPLPGTAMAGASPVPTGSVFIGCLDRKAFFQDHSGSPFLVDPAAFPSAAAGPGACGR